MDTFTATIIVSIVVYIAIGGYAGRGIRKLDDYYVAGRRAPTILIVGTLVASLMSSTMFLGEAGFTYDGQMGPFLQFPQASTIGYIYGAVLFGRYLRRSRTPTVADYFGRCHTGDTQHCPSGMHELGLLIPLQSCFVFA